MQTFEPESKTICSHCHGTALDLSGDSGGGCPHCFGGYVDLPPEELPAQITPSLARSFNSLVHSLGPVRISQLAELLESVIHKTGYGSLTLVITDHRLLLIKQEFSIKPSSNEMT